MREGTKPQGHGRSEKSKIDELRWETVSIRDRMATLRSFAVTVQFENVLFPNVACHFSHSSVNSSNTSHRFRRSRNLSRECVK